MFPEELERRALRPGVVYRGLQENNPIEISIICAHSRPGAAGADIAAHVSVEGLTAEPFVTLAHVDVIRTAKDLRSREQHLRAAEDTSNWRDVPGGPADAAAAARGDGDHEWTPPSDCLLVRIVEDCPVEDPGVVPAGVTLDGLYMANLHCEEDGIALRGHYFRRVDGAKVTVAAKEVLPVTAGYTLA
jgi:hypothetical protein|eukprot:gnl/Ergobibamus_cyprinoides/436.p1 GENE.gnl/Ergobibamus_cyprinoides/436~~gnl/Ergobibamus_cyprinoides/436.p1  ORF type:complete len:195 (-),score=37.01 gnl/Ergobibamus_cyprinoides/436:829-1392(-)